MDGFSCVVVKNPALAGQMEYRAPVPSGARQFMGPAL
jgi:hypothetical protein